jgi:hypothetical protein
MIHNHAAVAVVVAAAGLLLVVSRRGREAGPVYVTRSSPAAGLGILLAGVGVVIYARRHPAPGSAPPRQPSTVTRTITQQVTRYVPVHNWPVSGLELTLLGLGAIAAAILIVRLIGRYFGR